MNSTLGNRVAVDEETSVLHLHAADAAPRGISTGDRVRIFNSRGSCVLTAEVDGSVPPGVVSSRATRWSKRAPDRRNVNVLTSDRLTDAGGGPVFYSCLVEVERCGD
jgi:anaerobic selenocysteine-containing dehydrogenase